MWNEILYGSYYLSTNAYYEDINIKSDLNVSKEVENIIQGSLKYGPFNVNYLVLPTVSTHLTSVNLVVQYAHKY